MVVIGSKNVPAPGPGAAAYSASKAALTQLARVAALEWGADGIRVNIVHPNAVFDTGIWTRGGHRGSGPRQYGLTVEEYSRKNVLGVEVASTRRRRARGRDVRRRVRQDHGRAGPGRRRERAGHLTGSLDATQAGGRDADNEGTRCRS